MDLLNFLHPLSVVRWLHEPKSTTVHPEWGFPQRVGRYRPVESPFWSLFCWSCRDMEGLLIRRWDLILPGCGATSTLARGAALAARWLHEPQPIGNQPVGLGFPHRAGRYRPVGSPFSSPGCRGFRDMEGFLIRGWNPILVVVLHIKSSLKCLPWSQKLLILPGVRWLIRRWEPILPRVIWLYVRASANQRSASGAGVSTLCGAVSTRGISVFVPGLLDL